MDHLISIYNSFIAWHETLNSLEQSLVAAIIFALSVWIVRYIGSRIQKSGSEFMVEYQRVEIHKHLIHKHLIHSNNTEEIAKGFFYIMIMSLRYVYMAILILIFFLAINSIVEDNWWMVICYWLVFNGLYEAYTWIKDKSDINQLSIINQEDIENYQKQLESKK